MTSAKGTVLMSWALTSVGHDVLANRELDADVRNRQYLQVATDTYDTNRSCLVKLISQFSATPFCALMALMS
jgi:hypothetical protein